MAAKAAISSPLLESSIAGAHGVLISITVSPDVGLEDVDVASSMIAAEAAPDANVIWGTNIDHELEDEMHITIIATGFANSAREPEALAAVKKAEEKPAEPKPATRPQPQGRPVSQTRPQPKQRPARPEGAAPVRREKPQPRATSADEELDRLMKEFDTPKKKPTNR
jgi:cell division protein FtsZ